MNRANVLKVPFISTVVGVTFLVAALSAPFFVHADATTVTTKPADNITTTDATLHATNNASDADGHSFWVSTSTIDTSSPTIPDGVYSTPDFGSIAANTDFSAQLSSVTTAGVPRNMPAITPNTTYHFVAWSHPVGGSWTPGAELTFTTSPVVAPTPTATVVVTPANLHGWNLMNFDDSSSSEVGAATTTTGTGGFFRTGPATPPAQTGSFQEQVGTDGNEVTRFVTSDYNGVSLSNLTNLSYSTYVSAAQDDQAPYLKLRIDRDGNGTMDDALYFEPVYQNGTYIMLYGQPNVPNQCGANTHCVTHNTWQTWDVSKGGLWSDDDSAGGPPLTTLAAYVTQYPTAKLATDGPALRLQSGGGAPTWNNFVGNFDKLEVNNQITDTTYDFEPGPAPVAAACIPSSTFDTFTNGSVNGQGGWTSTGSYDQAVVDNVYGFLTFGCKSLRISNAVTSGGFGDQTFSPSNTNEAGESAADNGGMSGGTRQHHFDAQFDIGTTASNTPQPGLAISVSPDRGDGARMSYLRFEDQVGGIHVFFDDVTNPGPVGTPSSFNEVDIATLDRSVPHTVKFSMDFVNGPSNDVVKVYIDGVLVHTGTSWENYFRYDPQQTPSGNKVPTVDSLLIRSGGTAVPANRGKGFLLDNFNLGSSNNGIASTSNTVVVRAANLTTNPASSTSSWFFYNDKTDVLDNSLGSFVTGPATPPLGIGSAQISATTTQGIILATLGQKGTRLADISTLQYSTYRSEGTAPLALALQFDIDNDVTDGNTAYKGRLVYEPYYTHTVASSTWQTWNPMDNATSTSGVTTIGNWWFSNNGLATASGCSQATPCTWAQVLTKYPNAGISGGTDFKAGSNWSAPFTGNVDAFVFGTNNGSNATTTTYDFEPLAPVTPPSGGGGSSSGGGGSSSGGGGSGPISTGGSSNSTGGIVLGTSTQATTGGTTTTPAQCPNVITSYMRIGKFNPSSQVTTLQSFLNGNLGSTLPVTGFFGSLTDAAVRKFQIKYASDVLSPWGINYSTGYVYKTTSYKINTLACPGYTVPAPVITK